VGKKYKKYRLCVNEIMITSLDVYPVSSGAALIAVESAAAQHGCQSDSLLVQGEALRVGEDDVPVIRALFAFYIGEALRSPLITTSFEMAIARYSSLQQFVQSMDFLFSYPLS
jgi:hypothetical protein